MTAKCNFNERPMTAYEQEFGCPLDHCLCGTHDAMNEEHECGCVRCGYVDPEGRVDLACPNGCDDDDAFDVKAAEIAAGWDPTP